MVAGKTERYRKPLFPVRRAGLARRPKKKKENAKDTEKKDKKKKRKRKKEKQKRD